MKIKVDINANVKNLLNKIYVQNMYMELYVIVSVINIQINYL